jgi:hypothetical protein
MRNKNQHQANQQRTSPGTVIGYQALDAEYEVDSEHGNEGEIKHVPDLG